MYDTPSTTQRPPGQRAREALAKALAALPTDSCVEWTGRLSGHGYGAHGTGAATAHRTVFAIMRPESIDGLELDHLCRNRACVNPLHLEPVTRRENIHRGIESRFGYDPRVSCARGHALSDDDLKTNGSHDCRPCNTIRKAAWRLRRAA